MTAQTPDGFLLDGEEYTLAGINGAPPFDPLAFGLEPIGRATNCYRGFVCRYALDDKRLRLDQLRIRLNAERRPLGRQPLGPSLNGVLPQRPSRGMLVFDCEYNDIDLTLPFSGGLLLGQGFLSELYVHMGFHPAWKYRKVLELTFVEGWLCGREDRSETMAQFRASLAPGQRIVPSLDFIESAFSREYKI